jgi:hypothetical protein
MFCFCYWRAIEDWPVNWPKLAEDAHRALLYGNYSSYDMLSTESTKKYTVLDISNLTTSSGVVGAALCGC